MLVSTGMVGLLHLHDILWLLAILLEIATIALLARKQLSRSYPFFFSYLCSVVTQSLFIAYAYYHWGFRSEMAWRVAWGSQVPVILLRYLAVVEIIRKTLGKYTGIWAFARGFLSGAGLLVTLISLLFSKGQWQWVIMNANRGMELSIAAVIALLLLFSRYYRLTMGRLNRSLATGFCLYSAFYVINYSLLEKHLGEMANFWNFLGVLTFLASLLLWISAVGRRQEVERLELPRMISLEVYGRVSTELNLRLHLLNRQLGQFLSSEDHKQ